VQLLVVLELANVFQKNGIDPSKYTITFRLADNVPKQGVYLVIVVYEDVYGGSCFDVSGSFTCFDSIDERVGYNDRSLTGKSKDEFSNKILLDDGGSSSATSLSVLLKRKGKSRVKFTRMRAIIKRTKMLSIRKCVRSNYGSLAGFYPLSVAKQVEIHAEYANSIDLVKDKFSLRPRLISLTLGYNGSNRYDLVVPIHCNNNKVCAETEQPEPLYVPIKNDEEEPLPLDIMYPHSDVALSTRDTNTRGKAHYGLRSLGPLQAEIVHVKKPYNMVKVTNVVLGLRAQKQGLDVLVLVESLKLLHTDNDVHLFFDAVVKNGSIHLYVAHKKQNLRKYYYKNMEWEEEDADLRCSNSTRFTTRFKRKIIKSNMIGLRKKVKTCVIHDDGADRKRKKTVVN
nr:hypothetical protein [Tanacetum cinerariifolium]